MATGSHRTPSHLKNNESMNFITLQKRQCWNYGISDSNVKNDLLKPYHINSFLFISVKSPLKVNMYTRHFRMELMPDIYIVTQFFILRFIKISFVFET